MNITVFGATGAIGSLTVAALLERGHTVTAYARNAGKIPAAWRDQVRVVVGELTDRDAIDTAVAGAGAVISALGPSLDRRATGLPLIAGTDLILDAMKQHGVRRYVGHATPAVLDPQERPTAITRLIGFMPRTFMRRALSAHCMSVWKSPESSGSMVATAPGDRVVINPGISCGTCPMCLGGQDPLCRGFGVLGEHLPGTVSEYLVVPARNVARVGDHLSWAQAAALPLATLTAWRMLVTRAKLRAGETVLIWGIGGGVATAAFELARAAGAHTLVTSGSDEKLERALEWGADLAVNHASGDVVAAAKEAGGIDVVVETVGEATWARSLAAVKPGGRVTVCGATSGPNPPAQLHRFWWKQLTIYGSTMGTREDFLGAYELVRSGRARVHVDSTFPLAETRAAHERLERGEQLGKIVLTVPD